MKKILAIALIAAGLINTNVQAQDEITDATLRISGKEVKTSGDDNLKMNVNVTFNSSRNVTKCTATLQGTVSEIGIPDSDTARQSFDKKAVSVKKGKNAIKFRYSGPALAGDEGNQGQLNLQARIFCKPSKKTEEIVVITPLDATNVTCEEGLEVKPFLQSLKSRFK